MNKPSRALFAMLALLLVPALAHAQTADEIKLTNMVAAALAERDYPRAEWLAVTAKHHEMIPAISVGDTSPLMMLRMSESISSRNISRCSMTLVKASGRTAPTVSFG